MEQGLKTFHGHFKQVDGMLAGREWLGDKYSVLDPYGFVFYAWGVRRRLPMGELKNYTAFKDRMKTARRSARVLEDEKIKVEERFRSTDKRDMVVRQKHIGIDTKFEPPLRVGFGINDQTIDLANAVMGSDRAAAGRGAEPDAPSPQ